MARTDKGMLPRLLPLLAMCALLLQACSSDNSPPSPAPPASPPPLALFAGDVATTALPLASRSLVDAVGTSARFATLHGLTADKAGNLYVIDQRWIRKITSSASVTTLQEVVPLLTAITSASDGTLYFSAYDPCGFACLGIPKGKILRRTPAGDPSQIAVFDSGFSAWNLATDDANLYATLEGGNAIYKVENGQIAVIAGGAPAGLMDGSATDARFNCPAGIALDAGGNLYVFDKLNHAVRKITPQRLVTTVAVLPAPPASAVCGILNPNGATAAPDGTVYVADGDSHVVWKVTPTGSVSAAATAENLQAFAGTSTLYPIGVALVGNDLLIALETVVVVQRAAR